MRIIVATGLNEGEAEYKNMGDVAMLQAAVDRLRALWPEATIEVLTDSPFNLARYCPGAQPLPRSWLRVLGRKSDPARPVSAFVAKVDFRSIRRPEAGDRTTLAIPSGVLNPSEIEFTERE